MNTVTSLKNCDRVAKDGLSASEAKVQSIPPVWWDKENNIYYTYDGKIRFRSHRGNRSAAKRYLTHMGIGSKKANEMLDTCPNLKVKFKPTTLDKLLDGKYVNSFRPTKYMLMEPPTEPVEIPEFFKRVLDNVFPDPKDQDYYLNWVACIFQKKMRTGVALVIKGVQGTGKGLVSLDFLKPLFGNSYKGGVSNEHITSKWNGYMENKLIVQMNEVTLPNKSIKSVIARKIKAFVTEPTVQIRHKYQKPYEVDNYANIIVVASSHATIRTEPKDGRYRIFVTSNTPLTKFDWFNEVRKSFRGVDDRIKADMEQWAKFLHGYKADVSKLYEKA